MTLEGFRRIILPALGRFAFWGPNARLPAADVERLWLASTPYDADALPEVRYRAQDARGALLGRCPDVAVETCKLLRHSYEVLLKAQDAGIAEVCVMARAGCRCYGHVLNGIQLPVERGLAAFDGDETAPLLPPPQAPCCNSESPGICSIRLFATPSLMKPGDDPEFAKVLDEILGNKRRLPEGWADLIANSQALEP